MVERVVMKEIDEARQRYIQLKIAAKEGWEIAGKNGGGTNWVVWQNSNPLLQSIAPMAPHQEGKFSLSILSGHRILEFAEREQFMIGKM